MHIFGLRRHLARSNRFGAIWAQRQILHFLTDPPFISRTLDAISGPANRYCPIPSYAGDMRASRAVNENLLTRRLKMFWHFMWKNDDFFFSDSPTKKNSKTTCVLRRHMRSSALYAQVICAHMCRLRHLSTTNGLGAMERRSKKNRFFKKYMLAQKTYFPTSKQKALWHDYGRYPDTSTCVIRIWYVVG